MHVDSGWHQRAVGRHEIIDILFWGHQRLQNANSAALNADMLRAPRDDNIKNEENSQFILLVS
jgi:hypothetical protein